MAISASSVAKVVIEAAAHGLDLAAIETLTDAELEAKLYPKTAPSCMRPEPDCAALHLELRRPGVTLALLHVEFLEAHPDGLRYTAFCDRYRDWSKRRSPVMRQVHVAGDKMFVDYAGMKAHIVDATTGEVIEVELFVAVLGASNYTFAEATRTQSVPDFTASVTRAFTFFGGVTRAVVPDQLKSAVVKACRYDPGVQRTTAELARYYDTTILPARPKSPRDNAKVEVGVQVAERWLLARIRNETFTSLGALNARLTELVADLNGRTMRTYKASRRELFERLDKPALLPLPSVPFEACLWKKVGLNIDYHVAFEDHFYSAPHALRTEDVELWLRATRTTVEIFHARERVAAHLRSFVRGGFTTITEHMPSSHRAHAEWTPSRILGWAEQVGPNTRALCDVILRERRHPEWGYRSCLGLLQLHPGVGPLQGAHRSGCGSRRRMRSPHELDGRRPDQSGRTSEHRGASERSTHDEPVSALHASGRSTPARSSAELDLHPEEEISSVMRSAPPTGTRASGASRDLGYRRLPARAGVRAGRPFRAVMSFSISRWTLAWVVSSASISSKRLPISDRRSARSERSSLRSAFVGSLAIAARTSFRVGSAAISGSVSTGVAEGQEDHRLRLRLALPEGGQDARAGVLPRALDE